MPSKGQVFEDEPAPPAPLSWLYNFVHHQNLSLYIDQLEQERQPGRRDQLKVLLLEEEDRYGSLRERVDRTDLLVRRARARLAQQRTLVAQLASNGRDTTLAERTLANMVGLLEIFERYRDVLSESLERRAP